MKIDKALHDDYAILTLKGEFDTFYCPRFQEEVESLLEQGTNHVVLNMRLVKFINSTALGAIIKAHKKCQGAGGVLVVGPPSSFVKKVVGSLGIDQLVQMFDEEDAAIKHVVQSLNDLELAGDAPVEEETVLVTFPDDTRNQQIGGRKTLVGKMSNVDGQKVSFLWSGERYDLSQDQSKQLFFADSEIRLKFQIKLVKKGYFEANAKVIEANDSQDGKVRVSAKFSDMPSADEELLAQYAKDMEFLKRELPNS